METGERRGSRTEKGSRDGEMIDLALETSGAAEYPLVLKTLQWS